MTQIIDVSADFALNTEPLIIQMKSSPRKLVTIYRLENSGDRIQGHVFFRQGYFHMACRNTSKAIMRSVNAEHFKCHKYAIFTNLVYDNSYITCCLQLQAPKTGIRFLSNIIYLHDWVRDADMHDPSNDAEV
jgi:hypothetical protein